MKILYRASPYLSTNPNPLGDNKDFILRTSFESFKKALKGRRGVLINDSLSDDQLSIFPKNWEVVNAWGNEGTFHKQLMLACDFDNDEKVFLVEDDYLWKPDAIDVIEESLNYFHLVSPYDHPGHYIEDRFKYEPKQLRLWNGHVYREAPSNTLTFACNAWVIKQNLEKIKSFGIRDHEMFQSLGVRMWVPVPSLATHLVTGLLAPGYDWLKT